jgi:hypothetical protein
VKVWAEDVFVSRRCGDRGKAEEALKNEESCSQRFNVRVQSYNCLGKSLNVRYLFSEVTRPHGRPAPRQRRQKAIPFP